MSLFGKKKEETMVPACACKSGCSTSEVTEIATAGVCCGRAVDGICCVKILGSGCRSCHELYENTRQALRDMGLAIEMEYITDLEKVMAYGVMSMPALVVNEQVVSMGKALKAVDVEKLLHRQGF